MSKYALINSDGVVENLILWDGDSDWSPEDGFTVIKSDEAQIGGTYLNGVFTAPVLEVASDN